MNWPQGGDQRRGVTARVVGLPARFIAPFAELEVRANVGHGTEIVRFLSPIIESEA